MKASEIKAFEQPKEILVSTFRTRGVAGLSRAYNTYKTGEKKLEVLECNYEEGFIMGYKILFGNFKLSDGKKVFTATIRFYYNNKKYVQNQNSIPNTLKF
jgi:hypothetical protein